MVFIHGEAMLRLVKNQVHLNNTNTNTMVRDLVYLVIGKTAIIFRFPVKMQSIPGRKWIDPARLSLTLAVKILQNSGCAS